MTLVPSHAEGSTLGGNGILRHVPDAVSKLLRSASHPSRRKRVFLLLWWAGLEPPHAAALAAGPDQEVVNLWRAAGEPTDAELELLALRSSKLGAHMSIN